ncbi:hypothetical protein KAU37_06075 [Candidatus Bipolaricaulota bacterium]|nr:hypothetical protein [Candidatus Bipolaricaulota bacterium]
MAPTDRSTQELVQEALEVLRSYHAAIGRMLKHDGVDEEHGNLVGGLTHFTAERCRAVLVLVANAQVWDAEIVARSAAEATLKILFISYCEPSEREQRIDEFWGELGDIQLLRRSRRAREALERLSDKTGSEATALRSLVVTPECEGEIRRSVPRSRQRELNQKWSASEMLRSLEDPLRVHWPDGVLSMANYSYGIGSNLVHGDESALAMFRNYLDLAADDQRAYERGHSSKLMLDVTGFLMLIAFSLVDSWGVGIKSIDEACAAHRRLMPRLLALSDGFYERRTQEQACST